MMSGTCIRPNCPYDQKGNSRGYCSQHYIAYRLAHPPQDCAPVAAHVEAIRATGLGLRRISELTGVGWRTLSGIVSGTRKYVYYETAQRILTFPIPDIPHNVAKDGALVSAVGTTRRLQGLVALGYTQPALVELTGSRLCDVWRYLYDRRYYVEAATARRIAAAAKKAETLPPPTGHYADQARKRAALRGWLPLLAWDEDAIDDPAAEPRADAIRRSTLQKGCTVPDDFVDEYLDLRDFLELSDERIAERLGITEDALRLRLVRTAERRHISVDELLRRAELGADADWTEVAS